MYSIENVSQRVIALCNENNITFRELAKRSNLSISTVTNIVYCKTKNPRIITIKKICEGFGINLKFFFQN